MSLMNLPFFAILLCTFLSVKSQDVDQKLVDYYVNLIKSRTEGVQNFELPTDARMYEPENKTVEEYGEFDFIVIGAGTTGSVIANRLSEVEKWSVLLVEAGTFPDQDLSRIPAMYTSDAQTKFNWGFQTTPQKYACLGNSEARCSIPRGKGVGGSSLLNGMMYARGNKNDYDNWAYLLGDRSYTYKKLMPYFFKSENFTRTNFNDPIDGTYHGTTGPLHMSQSISNSDVQVAIQKGTQELGYTITDYNGQKQVGSSIVQYYLKNGFRDDPGQAFVSTATNRTNLKVLEESYVIKLDISKNNKRINGVVFTRNNKTFIARNRQEVILSAGSIGSPQILMLSGIGPKRHLGSLGIAVIKNLPVGENLHDHPYASLWFSSNISFSYHNTEELVKELLKGKGPLTSSVTFNYVSWFTIPGEGLEDNPDVEILLYRPMSNTPNIPNPFTASIAPTHAISKGSIRLKSASPFDYPLINTNHLSDDQDVGLMYKAFKITMDLIKTEAFRKLNVTLEPIEPDECSGIPRLSKKFWKCYLRRRTNSGGHLISTCLTGTNSRDGVVDKHLKVFGVKDLRVADASVIPFSFANHPTATCLVIAEKISDQIKREYRHDPRENIVVT